MQKDLENFIEQLEQAEGLLDQYTGREHPKFNPDLVYVPPEKMNLALFEDLPNLFTPESQNKPVVRIIHQLACSGGTIISRCLAALPNVTLLSEVNPSSQERSRKKPFFSPTDMTALAIYGKFPQISELSNKIFQADIRVLQEHTVSLGKYLLIRDHSQTDYFSDKDNTDVSSGTIRSLLAEEFELKSIVSVRHPADSYHSLKNNDWVRFSPASFDEYCYRYLKFLEQNPEVPIFKYEDFLQDPKKQVEQISIALGIPYNEDFLDVFEVYQLTGNSGRVSNRISARKRHKFSSDFRRETQNSKNYRKLCHQLKYRTSL